MIAFRVSETEMLSATQIRRMLAGSLVLVALNCFSQTTGTTVKKHREAAASSINPLVLQAETALQKQDYPAAEPLLVKAVAQDAAVSRRAAATQDRHPSIVVRQPRFASGRVRAHGEQ